MTGTSPVPTIATSPIASKATGRRGRCRRLVYDPVGSSRRRNPRGCPKYAGHQGVVATEKPTNNETLTPSRVREKARPRAHPVGAEGPLDIWTAASMCRARLVSKRRLKRAAAGARRRPTPGSARGSSGAICHLSVAPDAVARKRQGRPGAGRGAAGYRRFRLAILLSPGVRSSHRDGSSAR